MEEIDAFISNDFSRKCWNNSELVEEDIPCPETSPGEENNISAEETQNRPDPEKNHKPTKTRKTTFSVLSGTNNMKDIILALLTRALFAAHGLVGIWRAQTEWDKVEYWLLLVPIGLLVVEALFTVGIRGGEEYKWISPCVVLYLGGIVPSIWLLELKNFETRQATHYCSDQFWGSPFAGCDTNFKSMMYNDTIELVQNKTRLRDACQLELEYLENLANLSMYTTVPATTIPPSTEEQTTILGGGGGSDLVNQFEGAKDVLDQLLGRVNIFNPTTWVLVLHQLLLFILIIGRWLLPTGEGISRDELSQLLLVFIGVGADILEFVTETVKELSVRCDQTIIIIIMGFWTWSTFQFTLVLTAAKARRTRAVGIYGDESSSRVQSPVVVVEEGHEEEGKCKAFCTNMEVWGIMSTLFLQDAPFLAMRLYIMVGRNVLHQMIVFFTCKNLLVVILQLYRLAIIATKKKEEEEEEESTVAAKKLDAVKTLALAKNRFAKALNKPNNESTSKIVKEKRSTKVVPSLTNKNKLPEV